MLKTLEKYWGGISLLLILIILSSLFFWPSISQSLGLIGMFIAVAMSIVFLVNARVQAYRVGDIDSAGLMRKIVIDLLGLFITLAVIFLAAGTVSRWVVGVTQSAAEQVWPSGGIFAAIVTGTIAGIALGAVIGWGVRITWGKLTDS